jgi:hypothetical protein
MGDDQNTTQDQFDPFDFMAGIREGRGASEARVDDARYSTSLDEIATKYWLKAASEDDPVGYEKFSVLLEAERKKTAEEEAAEARRKAFEAEQAQLEEAEQAARMASIQDEAAAALREAEMEKFLAEGGIHKARELADTLSSREVSPSEALAAWDAASEAEREVAKSQFGVGVIDYDIDEVRGGSGTS